MCQSHSWEMDFAFEPFSYIELVVQNSGSQKRLAIYLYILIASTKLRKQWYMLQYVDIERAWFGLQHKLAEGSKSKQFT